MTLPGFMTVPGRVPDKIPDVRRLVTPAHLNYLILGGVMTSTSFTMNLIARFLVYVISMFMLARPTKGRVPDFC